MGGRYRKTHKVQGNLISSLKFGCKVERLYLEITSYITFLKINIQFNIDDGTSNKSTFKKMFSGA